LRVGVESQWHVQETVPQQYQIDGFADGLAHAQSVCSL
jgi:hypothetical protein